MKISIFHKKIPELFKVKVLTNGELREKLGQRFNMTKEESNKAITEMKDLGFLERKGKNLIYFRD